MKNIFIIKKKSESLQYFQRPWKVTENSFSFKRRPFTSTETKHTSTWKNMFLRAFQIRLCACVKTVVEGGLLILLF